MFATTVPQLLWPTRTTATRTTFSLPARIAYLVFTCVVTAHFMYHYSRLLVPLIPPASYGREYLICGGQIFWQLAFLAMVHQPGKWTYLLHMMTISFVGGLALGAIHLALSPFEHSPLVFGVLFTGVAGLMFFEHVRRTRILGVGSVLTVTWVLYRILLLAVILWLS